MAEGDYQVLPAAAGVSSEADGDGDSACPADECAVLPGDEADVVGSPDGWAGERRARPARRPREGAGAERSTSCRMPSARRSASLHPRLVALA